jgi:transcription elongation factor SPT6
MKYIRRKPVRDLVRDDFLKLQMAEDDKLLTISFDEEVDGLSTLPYIEEVKQLYIRVNYLYLKILNIYELYK